jgi:diguanylate cyclase
VVLCPIEFSDFEYTSSLAGQANALMAKYHVPPSPDNFAIWFRYVARSSLELTRTIDVLVSNRKPFDEATNRQLARIYLLGDQPADLSERIRGLVNGAKGLLVSAIDDQTAQIKTLQDASTRMSQSDPKVVINGLVDELLKATSRAKNLESRFGETSQELDKVKETLERADRSAKTDTLTGLANRRGLDEALNAAQIRAMESGRPLSILLIDIDHFKRFNDTYGHQVGDQVLRLTAGVFKEQLRETDFPARYGGEEMMGVLEGTDLRAASEVAERIRIKVSERRITRRSNGEALGVVTISIGVAEFQPGESIGDLVERADRALYLAKRNGRNRTVTELELEGDVAAAQ